MDIGVVTGRTALAMALETIQRNIKHEHVQIQHLNIMGIIALMTVPLTHTLSIAVSNISISIRSRF